MTPIDRNCYCLAPAVTAKVLGHRLVQVKSPFGAVALLPTRLFGALCAAADGLDLSDALRALGVPSDATLDAQLASLCERGILVSTGHNVDIDRANDSAAAMFGAHARAWTHHAYVVRGAEYFATERVGLAVTQIEASCASAGSILDLGCGPGVLALELARRGFIVEGVDTAEEMIAVARERLEAEEPVVRSRVTFRQGDLRVSSGPVVDGVTAMGVLAWFDEPRAVFEAARRRLGPGGLFLADFANADVSEAGPLWQLGAESSRAVLLGLIEQSRSMWFALATDETDSYLRSVRDACAGASVEQSRVAASQPDSPGPERRLSLSDMETIARTTGFRLVSTVGIGPIRTLVDLALPAGVADAVNAPLRALRGLPLSVLWSTGVLAVMCAED